MTDLDQDYLDETTAELEAYIAETGRQLNEYVKGNAAEEDIQYVAEKAVNAYGELEDKIDDVTEQIKDQDVFEEFRNEIEEAGYSGVDAFMEGRKPANASGKDPERQVIENLTSSDYVDTDRAFETMKDYMDLNRDLHEHYGVEAPLPELGEEGEKVMDDMERVEQMMEEENISAAEAVERIDFF